MLRDESHREPGADVGGLRPERALAGVAELHRVHADLDDVVDRRDCARPLPQPRNSRGDANCTAAAGGLRWNKAVAGRPGGGKGRTDRRERVRGREEGDVAVLRAVLPSAAELFRMGELYAS